jgi:hypothetical protein
MAVTTITPVQLALNTESADLPDASLTAVATAADGFSIAAPVGGFRQSLVIRMNNSGAGSNTVEQQRRWLEHGHLHGGLQACRDAR